MRLLHALLLLPTTLVNLLVYAQEPQHGPYDVPRARKYCQEHEAQLRQHAEIQGRLQTELPLGMRKMSSTDEGEKFRLEYWDLRDDLQLRGRDWAVRPAVSVKLYDMIDEGGYTNNTSSSVERSTQLRSPIRQHSPYLQSRGSFLNILSPKIFTRSFQCPFGTHSCASISRPNLCCSGDSTCISTSSGVGCCPAGETCEQSSVAGCDTDAGYTSCPGSVNGGCCVPGAKCEGAGCVFYGTRTVTTTLPTSTATGPEGRSSSGRVTLGGGGGGGGGPSIYTTTVTVTNAPSSFTTTRTIIVSASSGDSCSSGFITCLAASGGGCCRSGRICGTSDTCIDSSSKISTSTATASAPIRPTRISSTTPSSTSSISTATTTTSTAPGGCPNGYYMCSAYYLGDCCRVGRNCDTTSCPPMPSTTVVSGGVTIVVSGTGALSATSAAAQKGSCASGWMLCPSAVGGGCCPDGYLCGISSCRATGTGEGSTGKIAPSEAGVVRCAWRFGGFAFGAAGLMVWL